MLKPIYFNMHKIEEREAITVINQSQKIFGILHRPLSKNKVPAVVVCPGFAGNKCGKFRLFVTLGQELAKLGIAVLRFDYRGAGDSEGEFYELTLEGKVHDTLACLEFLSQDPQIDSTRLGLLGRSLGGAISILTAKEYKNIKSIGLWAPVFFSTPWKELWNSLKNHQIDSSALKEIPLPDHVPNLQFLEQFFKLNLENELEYLKNIPLLHIQGELDAIVKMDQAEAYKKARHGNEKTRFIQLPNSDHDFSNFYEQKIAIEETCKWYQQTLKPEV